jgi:hypothetical protein
MSKGYHIADIPKGILGEISKIEEEIAEYKDARAQDSKIMMAVELADLYGAISAYKGVQGTEWSEAVGFMLDEAKKLGLSEYDLMVFSKITERAFKSGARK